MLIIRLAGGLGNQIFQLGASLLIAKYNNIKHIIIDDGGLSDYEVKRENQLCSFFDLKKLPYKVEFKKCYLSRLRLPRLFPLKLPYYCFISDKNFQFMLKYANKKFLLLDGYFQACLTQELFNEEVKILKKIFISHKIEKKHGCVIHIRGRDFIELGWNNVTPKEYYQNAIKKMREDYNQENFYIVTDDKEYANNLLKDIRYDYEFIGGDMLEDFYLIGSFQYRILSSSTFAFWASALADNKHSIVIAPEYWSPGKRRIIYLPNEVSV